MKNSLLFFHYDPTYTLSYDKMKKKVEKNQTERYILMKFFFKGFEIVGPKKRLWTGMLIEFVWVVGEYSTVLAAYFVRDWRTLQLIFAVPLVVFLSYWKYG